MDKENLENAVEDIPKNSRFAKIKAWLYRYGPAEIIGTAAAYTSFFLAKDMTDSNIAAAYAGTIGENIGFYGTMISREIFYDVKEAKNKKRNYGLYNAVETAVKIFSEFGAAEVLDSLIIRPTALGLGSKILGKEIGVIAGKIAADIIFYVPTGISYKLRKYFSARNDAEITKVALR